MPFPGSSPRGVLPRIAAVITAAALAGGSLAAQTYLYENHNGGVPGAGWTQAKINPAAQGWIQSADRRAWHEDEFHSIGATDDRLVTPALDLSAAAAVYVHFYSAVNWVDYLANHPNSLGDGENDLWVSTDGGVNWTEIWTDTRVSNGAEWTHVDVSSYAGNAHVKFALRFYGTYAQEWWVDEFVVDSNPGYPPPPFYLRRTGACPGPVSLTTDGGTAFARVVLLYGAPGVYVKPGGPCAGIVLRVSPPRLAAVLSSDGAGSASVTFNAPASFCGRTVQAVDVAGCAASNTLVL